MYFTLFECAQQLNLHVIRQITNLIQENSPPRCGHEIPLFIGNGTRERTLNMPEELTRSKVLRYCPTINRHERPVLPVTHRVNQASDILFTRTTLPVNQNRHRGRPHQMNIFILPIGTFTHSFYIGKARRFRFCRNRLGNGFCLQLQSFLQLFKNLIRDNRLGHVVKSPQFNRRDRGLYIGIPCHQKHLCFRCFLLDHPQQIDPVLIRQTQIRQHEIESCFIQLFYSVLVGKSSIYLKSTFFQPFSQHDTKCCIVIHD